MTTYPAGTRVRCTLGPNVIEGVMDEDDVVLPDGTDIPMYRPLLPPWTVKVLQLPPRPEWADRPGTVVLDKDGTACQRQIDYWTRAGGAIFGSYGELAFTYGPLVLLHDPEAQR